MVFLGGAVLKSDRTDTDMPKLMITFFKKGGFGLGVPFYRQYEPCKDLILHETPNAVVGKGRKSFSQWP